MDKDLIKAWDARFPSDEARERAVSRIFYLVGQGQLHRDVIRQQAEDIVNELLGEVNHILDRERDDLK
jgi:hypothetical protein